ncbi:MAG: zinc ABC transporter substrate-binding protein [Gemmatimonadetes bacterium]|nr:zinc ABC transporter substrate-binding protein [Gemmatimonadota bacterium]MBI2537502.1 zinc ABC transporter substrate-binding protein [Gemmatimonadota bacterium]
MNPSPLLVGLAAALVAPPGPPGPDAPDPVRVVTSLTTYAAIAREIAGDKADVVAIAQGDENPHFVQPRPSFVLTLRRADMFVVTGLDLELWAPALLDKANNPKLASGAPGFVTAYNGIALLDVPEAVSRAHGDIHVYGNPHLWTDPANAIVIGRNILTGLKRIAPEHTTYFEERYQAWKDRVIRAYVGDDLVQLLGADAIANLGEQGKLFAFLSTQQYQGQPLLSRAGGWLKQGEGFRGQKMVCYHKEWDYFSRAFGVPCVDYIEPKPGIPPTPRHVAQIIDLMKRDNIKVLFSTNYYDRGQVETVAARTNATAVIVPSNAGGAPGTDTYIDLVNTWVKQLATAFRGRTSAHP